MANIRTAGQKLQRNADGQFRRNRLHLQPAAFDRMRRVAQQKRQRIFRLPDRVAQIVQRCFGGIERRFGLDDGGFIGIAGRFQRPHDVHLFPVTLHGLLRDGHLRVEAQQPIVVVGHIGYQLRLHRIAVGFALQQSRTRTSFGVGQATENIDLPARRDGNVVRPRGFRAVEAARTAVGAKLNDGR